MSLFYCGAFFYDKFGKRILLQLRDNNTKFNPNKWGLFGGLNETGEIPLECIKREIKEELGVYVNDSEIKFLYKDYGPKQKIDRYIFFIDNYIPLEKIILGEGEAVKWIGLKEVFDYKLTSKTYQDLKVFIEKFNLKL